MNQVATQSANSLGLSEKELKFHASQLQIWLWQRLNNELWDNKLACGKTLAELTLRMVPLLTDTDVIKNWAMIVAMMLNGTKDIYGDPDPFNMERGKSPEAQAWRLLVMNSLAFLPGEGYVVSTANRIALNTIDVQFDYKIRLGKSIQEYGADIVHYLNYEGQGNSIAWFRQLDVMQYQSALLERIQALVGVWQEAFSTFAERMPKNSAMAACLTRQKYGLQTIVKQAPKMVAPALQDISALLRPLQNSIPPNAEKEFGERAALPYRLKKMLQNPAYAASFNHADIERTLARYLPHGAHPATEGSA